MFSSDFICTLTLRPHNEHVCVCVCVCLSGREGDVCVCVCVCVCVYLSARLSRGVLPCAHVWTIHAAVVTRSRALCPGAHRATIDACSMAAIKPRAIPVPIGKKG